MKTKILAITIIICSIISGLISASLLNYFQKDKTLSESHIKNEITSISSIKSIENEVINIVKKASASVVSIIIKKDLIIYKTDPWLFFKQPTGTVEKKVGGGTGFFIKKDGTILTNKHVISDTNATYTIITNDNKQYDAKVIALAPNTDLAVIKIIPSENFQKINFTPLNINQNSKDIKLGQFVIAIGNTLGEFQNSISLGIVSGKNRTIEIGNEKITSLIQTDATINPGNSGGPLVNLNGNVIAINTATINGSQRVGFAISLTRKKIDYIIKSIEKYGEIKRPFIGVNYINIGESLEKELNLKSNYGAYISFVSKESSAEKLGIRSGDIILEINSKKIINKANIDYIIQNKIPGEKIKLKILKKSGETKEIELELGEI